MVVVADEKEAAVNMPSKEEAPANADEVRLAQLGYKQELKRGMSMLTNFGVSFTIVSFLTSITGSFGNAWFWGGPVSAVWGWIIASFFTLFVATAMAEICSAYPTSGGMYYWSARLGGRHAVFASWVTGWFNLLGQVAITAGVGMACTNAIVAMSVMGTSPARLNRHGGVAFASIAPPALLQQEPCPFDVDFNLVTSYPWPSPDMHGHDFGPGEVAFNVAECSKSPINLSQPQVYGIYIGVMSLAALMNCFSVRFLSGVLLFSIFWHVCGSLVITFGLPGASVHHLSKEMIWTRFQPSNWNALYQHGAPPGRNIYQGFTANDAINWGGNGISATDHAHSMAVGDPAQLTADYGDPNAATSFAHFDNLHEISTTGGGANKQSTMASPAYPYIFFCGMLMSQWCYTGYDASAHMVEETENAAVAGPRGIITTIIVTFIFGLSYIIGIVSSVQDYNNTLNGPLAVNYNPAAQIFWDVCETRFGNGRFAMGFWIIPIVAMFLCTVGSITSNSRMLYAFSRDDAVPGSKYWHVISKRYQIPVNAVGFMYFAACILALPTVQSSEAFSAVTSIAVIGLYISYVVPVFCRIVNRPAFVPGPFYLGERLSLFVAIVAVSWVCLITVIFVLPSTYPISMKLNFNYAIIAVGVVLTYSMFTWFLPGPRPFNARTWFKGPNIAGLSAEIPDGGPGASMKGYSEGDLPPPVPFGV